MNFEGESVKELTTAFHEAVDDYLAYCKDEGIEPDKSFVIRGSVLLCDQK